MVEELIEGHEVRLFLHHLSTPWNWGHTIILHRWVRTVPLHRCTGGIVKNEMTAIHTFPLLQVDVDCIVTGGRLLFACVSDNHPCFSGFGTFVEAGCRYA